MPDTDFGTTLLALARTAIAHRLGRGPAPVIPDDPRLREKGATFITLARDGELRGCIGSLRRSRELGEDVIHNALAAAFEDSRFEPLAAEEFGGGGHPRAAGVSLSAGEEEKAARIASELVKRLVG